MKFEITILGSGSAVPTVRRNPSAQVVNINENYSLIDCAEGTQMQMRKFGISMLRIDQIYISHLHGDHYLGLPGYLQTLHLLGRTRPIQLFGPADLMKLLEEHFRITHSIPRFEIKFTAVNHQVSTKLFENKLYEVWSIPLKHKIATSGFLFREKPKLRNIIVSALKEYRIPVYWLQRIKEGSDYEQEDGTLVPNGEITLPPAPVKSYAYCSDTAYSEEIVHVIQGVNLLYHEASFLDQHADRARETMHSTAAEAAKIAALAGVKRLLLGHFSARYRDTEEFIAQAKPFFEDTLTAEDGMAIVI
ncbi:MAG TPA: ribonuclease Z [Luteibaculaceae bacterium]|nr:ribonuclease Z [Luteibaculaceae bacterium]